MYFARPISVTRSTSPGRAPNPMRFSTCATVAASGFDGMSEFRVAPSDAVPRISADAVTTTPASRPDEANVRGFIPELDRRDGQREQPRSTPRGGRVQGETTARILRQN